MEGKKFSPFVCRSVLAEHSILLFVLGCCITRGELSNDRLMPLRRQNDDDEVDEVR